MLGQLIEFIEMKSNMRKTKSNGGKGLGQSWPRLCWPCIWNKTKYYIKQVMRKAGVNG